MGKIPANHHQANFNKTMRIDITARERRRMRALPRPHCRPKPANAPEVVGDASFQELFQSVYDAAVITSAAGVIMDANMRALEFLLCARADLVGRKVEELIMGFDSPLFDQLNRNLENNRFALIQAYTLRQDGSTFPSEISVSLLHPAGLKYLCFFIRDVTVRFNAEEELKADRNLMRTLVDHLPDFVYVKDAYGRYILANSAISRHLGLAAPEGLTGYIDADFYPPDLAAAYAADDRRVLEQSDLLINREEPCVDRNGKHLDLLTTKVPIKDSAGNVTGLVGISRDITERRVQESQRAHAQKMESIGQLAAGIAHEINTPVQYIGDNLRFLGDNFGGLLKLVDQYERLYRTVRDNAATDGVLPEVEAARESADLDYIAGEIPAAIAQSLEGVTRVSRIVQAMKEFSHPDTEDKTPADLNRAIESTLAVSHNEWKYVAEMVKELDPRLPPVPCFLGHFNQVILNLVVNAAHAIAAVVSDGGQGKGTLTVATRHDGDWAEIRVSDTGTGIPEKFRPRIFEPFFTTKEVGKGTGQGLSTCHAIIVRKHGGTIRFETEEGRGTTFVVRLPLA